MHTTFIYIYVIGRPDFMILWKIMPAKCVAMKLGTKMIIIGIYAQSKAVECLKTNYREEFSKVY